MKQSEPARELGSMFDSVWTYLQGRQFITCKFAFLRSEKSQNEGEEVGDNLGPLKPS